MDGKDEEQAKLPRRPTPECRIKEDCRWCGHGWDITEYCNDGRCFNREPDERCVGKKNGLRLRDGTCWSEQREQRCQNETFFCSDFDDCESEYYCQDPKSKGDLENLDVPAKDQESTKPDKRQGKPGKDERVPKPADGPSLSKPGQSGANTPKPEGKPIIPKRTADSNDQAIGVCAPCDDVDCVEKNRESEVHSCCVNPIIEPPNRGLRVLIICLIVFSCFVCISLTALVLFYFIRYRRLRREVENMRLYNQRAVNGYQGPVVAAHPENNYEPGSAVVRVLPTPQESGTN